MRFHCRKKHSDPQGFTDNIQVENLDSFYSRCYLPSSFTITFLKKWICFTLLKSTLFSFLDITTFLLSGRTGRKNKIEKSDFLELDSSARASRVEGVLRVWGLSHERSQEEQRLHRQGSESRQTCRGSKISRYGIFFEKYDEAENIKLASEEDRILFKKKK